MGRILTEEEEEWPAVAGNLVKARKSWGRMQGVPWRALNSRHKNT